MSEEVAWREVLSGLEAGDRRKIVRALARLIHEQDRKVEELERLRQIGKPPKESR